MLRRSLFCLAMIGLSTGLVFAQGAKGGGRRVQGGGDLKSLLDQGLYSFEEGDAEGALQAFEQAFALNPSSDAISTFVKRASEEKIFQMLLSKNKKLAGVASQILEASSRVVKTRQGDAEQVKQVVEDTLKSESHEQLLKMVQNANAFGRNLVPALIPVLADADLGRRAVAINWIGRYIGRDAIPVLQAARKHPSAVVRRNVAELLGARLVRHPVNLATLKAMMETDPTSEVKSAASEAYAAIQADLSSGSKEAGAKEHFLENALAYYSSPHSNPFGGTQYTPTIYTLEGEAIAMETVADFQLSDRMAQQALEEALELDPGFHEAQVLTLCNDAAQVHEYDLNVAHYAKDESQPEVKALLEKQKPYVDYVLRNRLLLWPSEVLYDALAQSLEDGRPEVSRKLIDTIRETERGGRAPQALVKALEDNNSRLVRASAAIALAHWNPTSKDFTSGEVVVSILSETVLSSGVRTVQKAMGDAQLANRFAEMLDQLNMESYAAVDSVEKAYAAAINTPPDVIVMDDSVSKVSGKKEVAPVNFFISELRKNYRTANVPVVVVVPSSNLENARKLYESEERKVVVVPDSIDRLGLQGSVFNKIFQDKDDAKAQATAIARSAAEALDQLAQVPTRMPFKNSADALRKVLKNRPDEVRLPSLRALGHMRAAEAAGDLAAVAANAENSKPVRVEALRAMGMALAGAGGAGGGALKAIEEIMGSDDVELRRAAWFAYSSAGADPKNRLSALLMKAPAGGALPAERPAAAPAGGAEEKPAEESGAAEDPAPAPAEEAPAEEPPAEQN